MIKRPFLIVVLSVFSISLVAQVNDSVIDSLVARKSITEKVSLKFSTYNAAEWFEVAGSNGNPGTEIRPNSAIINAIGFNYRFASFSYKFLISVLPGNDDDREKGETKSNGLHFALNPGQWTTDLGWSKTQGYYLHNSIDFNPNWTKGDQYVQFPNLHSQIYRLRLGRVLNPEYSINAVTLQTENQVISQGSFLPGLRLTYYSVDDKSPLAGNVSSSQKSNQFEGIISFGYTYTLVLGNGFYTNLDLRPGLGFLQTHLLTRFARTDNVETNSTHFVSGFDANVQLGFDSPKFFSGIRVAYDHYEHAQGNTDAARITNERLRWEFFLGIRLKAPENLKRKVDAAEAQLLKEMIKRKQRMTEKQKG